MISRSQEASGEMTSSAPMVSVVITSYNSGAWIGQAISSVLAQQTTFSIEIVISDDASKDDTVAIAERFRADYPQTVRVIARPQNVGTQRNYFDAFQQSRGKYIAWLDADDYWTDPAKLQLQVEALEADPALMICGHYVRWVTRGANAEVRRERFPTLPPGRHGMLSILHSNFLPSPSVVFRNGLQQDLPEWYFDVSPLTDWPLYVVAATQGDILLLDRVMADYTLNTTSAFWGEGTLFWHRMNADFFTRVEAIIPARFHRGVRASKGKRFEDISYILRKKGDFRASRQTAFQAVQAPALLDNVGSKLKTLVASLVRELQWRLGGSKAPPPAASS